MVKDDFIFQREGTCYPLAKSQIWRLCNMQYFYDEVPTQKKTKQIQGK